MVSGGCNSFTAGQSCLGAVIGDYVGSRFEFEPTWDEGFEIIHPECFFTDDSILSLAVEDVVKNGGYEDPEGFAKAYRRWFERFGRYEKAGWGGGFYDWASGEPGARTDSWGNGCVMRLSAIPNVLEGEDTVARVTENSCIPSHNHPISIASARLLGQIVYHLRGGAGKEAIRLLCGYSGLAVPDYEDERRTHEHTLRADRTLAAAASCVVAATSFEDAIRKAVLLKGDADTLAAVAGSMAEHLFGIPEDIQKQVSDELEKFLAAWAWT
jgi:ADP-ribosylglycohydrolase